MQRSRQVRPVRARRGSILVLTAFMLVFVIAFVAFTVDVGYITVTRAKLQAGADASALGAALELGATAKVVREAALEVAAANDAAGHSIVLVEKKDVEIGTWNDDTMTFTALPDGLAGSGNAVRVTCRLASDRNNALNLFFAPILGTDTADMSVSAIALKSSGSCGAFIGLNRVYLREECFTDSYDSTVGDYSPGSARGNGDVCSNGHIRLIGTAGIDGDAHPGPYEDGVDMDPDDNYVTGDTTKLENVIDYPAVDLSVVRFANDNAWVPPSSLGNVVLQGDGSLKLDGSSGGDKKKKGDDPDPFVPTETLDLPPGTYFFTGIELGGGAVVNVSGPTYIYVEGDVDLTDGGFDNQTRKPVNLQIYPVGEEFWLPTSVDLHAVVYSTTSAVEKEGGSAGFYGKLVGQKVKINGSGGLHADESVVITELKSGGAEIGGPAAGLRLVE